MKFSYRAFDIAGKQVSNSIDASTTPEARENLRRQGFFVTELELAGSNEEAGLKSKVIGRVGAMRRLKDVSGFTRQLHALLSSGTPLVQGIVAIERQCESAKWAKVLGDLRGRVERGTALSEALKCQPLYFDTVIVSLIAAGEAAGNVSVMLDRVATLTRKQLKLRSALVGAMIYPVLLCLIGVLVVLNMLLFVLPRFAGLFKTLDTPLPPTTKFLMWLSGLLTDYWWLGLSVMAISALIAKFWFGSAANRQRMQTAMLNFPKVGRLLRNLMTARLSRLLGTLLESKVPLLDALELTRAAAGGGPYAKLIGEAEEAVTRGEAMSTVLGASSLISPSVQEAFRNGEQTGQIGPPLMQMADFLDEENEIVIKSATTLIEPAILIVLGVLVGFMALSMFLPLFDLVSAAHAS
jgi:type II secretory pathway component PulF